MSDLSNIQLIEKQQNIETYTASLKIVIKKFIARDINEALLFKMKLLENKNSRRIYEIREDHNILYIFISPEENINDLLVGKITKEIITKGHCEPIKKKELSHLFQYEESMCKIRYHKIINNELKYVYGSGFFLVINIKDIPFNKCLITNNHVLNEDFFKTNKVIEIEYLNEIKIIQINKRRIFTNESLDFTCIEIFNNDNIKRFFLINKKILKYNINIFLNKDIFILQYPQGEDISFSEGKIVSTHYEDFFTHNCSTLNGSSGSPIILREDSSVIGLHHSSLTENENNKIIEYNLSTSFLSIVKYILKKTANYQNNQIFIKQNNFINNNPNHNNIYNQIIGNNYFIAEYSVDEQNIYQNIKILNSYEQYKRENPQIAFNKNYENEKELIEFCKIEIDGKIIPFSYYYQFKNKNLRIKYIFTKNIRQMNYMFSGIKHLVNIDLSNFDAQNVVNLDCMFYQCNSLSSINLTNFNAQNVVSMNNFLSECVSLKIINLSNFNAPELTNMSKMFYHFNSLISINLLNLNIPKVTSMEYMFYECKFLKMVNFLNINAPKINNMAYMFYNCNSLTSMDISFFKTQNVTNMEFLFSGCTSLNSINLMNFNTKNVTNMNNMFYGCQSLKYINLSNFDTKKVTNMAYMFSGCKILNQINLSNFNTQNVKNMSNMFSNCQSIEQINLLNFNTKNVIDIDYMFSGCISLNSINLSNFNTQNVKNMEHLFSGCKLLKYIDLSNLRINKETKMENVIQGCKSLITLNLSKSNILDNYYIKTKDKIKHALRLGHLGYPDLITYEKIEYSNMKDIFNDCESSISVNLSYCIADNINNMSESFSGINNIISINLSNLHAQNVTNMKKMFSDCTHCNLLIYLIYMHQMLLIYHLCLIIVYPC